MKSFTLQSGTSLRSPFSAHAIKVFEHMTSISAAQASPLSLPLFDVMVGYEYFPLRKVRAVAPDATAFRSRGPQVNVAQVISWDKDGEEGLQYARKHGKDIIKLIESTEEWQPKEDENDVYGNYGMFPHALISFAFAI